ncbi:hypothetical protein WAE58_23820 [Pedobacter panaciterrae]|uniref:Secreted protein n=1 Tax=Pedobacter panaciterrae TaxID=363849 RepID=A0ABU8NT84_9SPHI
MCTYSLVNRVVALVVAQGAVRGALVIRLTQVIQGAALEVAQGVERLYIILAEEHARTALLRELIIKLQIHIHGLAHANLVLSMYCKII